MNHAGVQVDVTNWGLIKTFTPQSIKTVVSTAYDVVVKGPLSKALPFAAGQVFVSSWLYAFLPSSRENLRGRVMGGKAKLDIVVRMCESVPTIFRSPTKLSQVARNIIAENINGAWTTVLPKLELGTYDLTKAVSYSVADELVYRVVLLQWGLPCTIWTLKTLTHTAIWATRKLIRPLCAGCYDRCANNCCRNNAAQNPPVPAPAAAPAAGAGGAAAPVVAPPPQDSIIAALAGAVWDFAYNNISIDRLNNPVTRVLFASTVFTLAHYDNWPYGAQLADTFITQVSLNAFAEYTFAKNRAARRQQQPAANQGGNAAAVVAGLGQGPQQPNDDEPWFEWCTVTLLTSILNRTLRGE